MRILVGWEDEAQAETIYLCLNVDDNVAEVCTQSAQFEEAIEQREFDVVLLSLTFPDGDAALELFETVREKRPDLPVIGAWEPGEILHLVRFVSRGLHSHLHRDASGDFIFLLTALIEATYSAVLAERSRIIADKLSEEIRSVRRLQESIVPRRMPQFGDYHVVARYEPSRLEALGSKPVVMAGGDYYDAFSLDDSRWALLVGDASGHGMRACMSIMTMHTLIHMIREQRWPDTRTFVSTVNQRLCSSDIVQGEGGFITLLYLTLDTAENCIEWTSAGHPMPLLQELASNEIVTLGNQELGGLPLGIDEDWEYEVGRAEIPPNSRLLLYTDGLDEAFPAGGDECDQFGLEGIKRSLQSAVKQPLEDALQVLFHDSDAATQGGGRHDDTSAILLQRGNGAG